MDEDAAGAGSARPCATTRPDCRPGADAHLSSHSRAGASTASDFYEMRNAYMNERFAPELLPHCNDLVARISKVIEDQVRPGPAGSAA